MGSKSALFRTLIASSSGETAAFDVHRSVLKWRATLADFAIFKKCLPANILYCHTNVVDSNRTARSGPPISRAAV